MREYKFRVWDKDTKRMHICGEDIHDEIDFEQGTNKVFYYNLQNGCGSLTENSSYILMQYTGLKDKNGKEIYEGDISFLKTENLWALRIERHNNSYSLIASIIDDDIEIDINYCPMCGRQLGGNNERY